GGSSEGICEVDKDTDCVWQLIYDRLKRLNKLDNLLAVRQPRDWRTSTNAGQRKTKFEEAML
ncbi:MAG: methylenetetrahydrofolate reductase C-terminal domain-containing protein, partial [bacterium]